MKLKILYGIIFYGLLTNFVFSQEKKIIAILDFYNTSKEEAINYLQNGIPESMMTYLANYKEFSIVERARLKDALNEMQLGMTGVIDETTASKIGHAVGANAIIVGSYLKVGNKVRINARLIDVQTGKILLGEQVTGDIENEIFQLLDKVSEKMAKRLLGKPIEREESKSEYTGPQKKSLFFPIIMLGSGIGCLAGAGVTYYLAESSYSKYQDATTADDAVKYREDTKKYDKLTLILGSVGGGVILTYAILKYIVKPPFLVYNNVVPEDINVALIQNRVYFGYNKNFTIDWR